jgi:GNAT superfamily N-acetyltransferase
MPPDVTIRPATPTDIPALMMLIEQSVRVLQQGDYPPSQIDASIGSAFGIDRQLLADQTYFVAVTPTGELAACGGWSYRKTLCGCDILSSRDNGILDPATDFAKIRAIFVHPNFARQGLGTLILNHCEAAAHAAGFARLEMGSTITGAKLYALRGYIERERITVPLPNGEDLAVIRMEKTL